MNFPAGWKLGFFLLSAAAFANPPPVTNASVATSRRADPSSSSVKIIRANCGPIVLQKVFQKHGIKTELADLIKETNTYHGLTTLYDMKQAVLKKGLHAEAIQTDLKTLCQLAKTHDIVCHFSQNNHYLLIRSITDKEIEFFDPSWAEQNNGIHAIWRRVFEQEWKGICLVISEKPLKLAALPSD